MVLPRALTTWCRRPSEYLIQVFLHWISSSSSAFRRRSSRSRRRVSSRSRNGHRRRRVCPASIMAIIIIIILIMAEWQVFLLGRDGQMPSGRIIRHWVRLWGRCCIRTRRFSQRGKICQHWKQIPLCAHRGRNLGPRWTRRHANCLLIWEVRSPRRQAMTEKELFCSRQFRCWCSATTLYCYTTPCQPLTARTDDLYPFVYYLNF